MKLRLILIPCVVAALWATCWLRAQSAEDPLIEGFRLTEVSAVSDAMEQLYGKRIYMYHDMRPLFTTKFAGPAVTVQLKKEESKEGVAAAQPMLQAIDEAPAGSVYVAVVEDGLDNTGLGGLMATGMKVRGLAGAVVDASIRDVAQIRRLQFPVFSRGIVPSTAIGHYRATINVPVSCGGVNVNPNDIVSADEDGVVVVPRAVAAAVLKKAQELDQVEHSTYPLIEKFKSIREAVAKFGRI